MTGLGRIVIVGASLAGLRAAESLRRKGFDGHLTLVGAEEHLPYDRPPLSKQFLRGEWGDDDLALRGDTLDDAAAFAPLEVELQLGRRATALDVAGQRLIVDGDDELPWDGLVIATGSAPRRLPAMPELDGLFVLRTIDDARAIAAALADGAPRVVVVGGGFIGAEVAASARTLGLDVTILEALPVPLSRVLGPEMGAACAALHLDHGVRVRCGVVVEGFAGRDRVEGVRLAGGEVLSAEVVVVGIGVRPATDWLEGSGLELRDGVVCDDTLLAGPGIVAAGDVCRWPSRRFGEEMRVEHWTNAVEQGMHGAQRLLAPETEEPPVFDPVPYVWSDQYDAKIMFVGRSSADDEVRVVDGSVDDGRFVAVYGRHGRVVGALAMNNPRGLMRYRQMIDRSASWEEAVAPAG